MKKKKIDKTKLVGRDPTKGMLSFKTGIIKTIKDKLLNRNSKIARKKLKGDINEN